MHRFIYTLAAVAVLIPITVISAELHKERAVSNSAEANFLTNFGCEDVSVGVSVTEKKQTVDTDKSSSAVLQVFGSIIDTCEFGTSTSFFGTTTVTREEFKQNGVDSAQLIKTFSVDGTEINLSLTWKGIGVIGGEDLKINDKDGATHITQQWDVDSRNAEVTGTFIVHGINRISEASLVNAQLEVVKTKSKTKTK